MTLKNLKFCAIVAFSVFANVHCLFINPYSKLLKDYIPPKQIGSDNQEGAKLDDGPGKPLFLTPLIEQGKIKEAQQLAQTNFSGFKNMQSFAGYLTVDKRYDSNMFFWFFPAEMNYANAPVVLWLQGGPGASSLIGLFGENGPYTPKHKHGLKLRPYSWTKVCSMLYIDNPVGTGYSFTNGGFAQNQTKVGEDLYSALLQFFQLFPNLQKNDFYVTGESYGGKYVPAISYAIHKSNPAAKLKINFQGMAIGNGFSDPVNQVNYADFLYQIGLLDLSQRKVMQDYQEKGVALIKAKKYQEAAQFFDSLIDSDFNKSSLFKNYTGFNNYYNYLIASENDLVIAEMQKYLQRDDIRAAVHVGNATFMVENPVVELSLINDIMQSVTPWISELLSHYRVLIYNGQLDIIVTYVLTENYLENLSFDAAAQYKTATRHVWKCDKDLAGYVKQAGNLTFALVRNAGHMVPADQPKWALDLISRFIHNKPFY